MLTINTNISSLIAQTSMKQSTNKLNEAIERMTTGFKINHAKDNAANYAISTNMTTKINSLMVAEDNAAMGLDMVTTAEENLSLIQSHLTRLRDLQEQASNGTYGEESLKAINAEANALVDEIERLYNTAEYNGINLMKGQIAGTEESKFIKDIDRRDTSYMVTLASVDETKKLEFGTYSISTAEELAKLATMTDKGLIGADTEFVLANDIDLQAWCDAHAATGGWEPIGSSSWSDPNVFNATFDGNGYMISNLTINRSQIIQGLFGRVGEAVLKNLGIVNARIISGAYSGLIAGSVYSTTVENLYSEGEISTNSDCIGGLFGEFQVSTGGFLYSAAILSGYWGTGGIAGASGNDSKLSNSFFKGTINNTNGGRAGGLIGTSSSNMQINNCYTVSTVTSLSNEVGGLVGRAENLIVLDCYSKSSVSGNNSVGGLIGSCNGGNSKIKNCAVLKDSSGLQALFVGALSSSSSTLELNNNKYLSTITSTDKIIGNGDSIDPVRFSETNTSICDSNLPFEISASANIMKRIIDCQLQIGTDSTENSRIEVNLGYSIDGIKTLRKIGSGSGDYLTQLDGMLSSLNEKQTHFGAVSNRLESVLDEIAIKRDNLISSRSTIRDADIAETSSTYIQQQILQQASATLLATANQSPSIALQLI